MDEVTIGIKNSPKFQVFPEPLTYEEKRVREITKQLNELGIKVFAPSFPFAMHHGFYRVKFRPSGRHATHQEVSRLLRRWADGRAGQDDYVWQAICGGLLQHFKKSPNDRLKLPADVVVSLEGIEWGEDFERYLATVSAELHAAAPWFDSAALEV